MVTLARGPYLEKTSLRSRSVVYRLRPNTPRQQLGSGFALLPTCRLRFDMGEWLRLRRYSRLYDRLREWRLLEREREWRRRELRCERDLDLDFDLDLERDFDLERERWDPSLDLPGELLVDFTEPLGLTLRDRDSCTNTKQMRTAETEQEHPMHHDTRPLLAN